MSQSSNSLDGILLQLAMGFGQGAGTMLATESALIAARDAYRTQIEQKIGSWPEYALQTIEYARVLGSLAAANALRDGRAVIEGVDVEYGLNRVAANTLSPLAACRISE